MKKAEMEAHHAAYQIHTQAASAAERKGLFKEAVGHAKEAWPHVEGFLQLLKKLEESPPATLRAFQIVLKYAPLLLDCRPLEELAIFLEERRRSQALASLSLTDAVAAARSRLAANHRLWSRLEVSGDLMQSDLRTLFGGEQDDWRETAETWSEMGLMGRAAECGSYRLSLATRMGQVVPAKCPKCGDVSEAPKAMFLERMRCPVCHEKVLFVLLAPPITQGI